jgi:chromosome segregation ATPase
MNSTERENYEYLKARVVNLESDLRAALSELKTARAELEAARGRVTELEAELKQPISDTALRKRNDGYLPVGNGCMLVTSEEWTALEALRSQIDGAEIVEVHCDRVVVINHGVANGYDRFEIRETDIDMQPGETRTFKLLEVKP